MIDVEKLVLDRLYQINLAFPAMSIKGVNKTVGNGIVVSRVLPIGPHTYDALLYAEAGQQDYQPVGNRVVVNVSQNFTIYVILQAMSTDQIASNDGGSVAITDANNARFKLVSHYVKRQQLEHNKVPLTYAVQMSLVSSRATGFSTQPDRPNMPRYAGAYLVINVKWSQFFE